MSQVTIRGDRRLEQFARLRKDAIVKSALQYPFATRLRIWCCFSSITQPSFDLTELQEPDRITADHPIGLHLGQAQKATHTRQGWRLARAVRHRIPLEPIRLSLSCPDLNKNAWFARQPRGSHQLAAASILIANTRCDNPSCLAWPLVVAFPLTRNGPLTDYRYSPLKTVLNDGPQLCHLTDHHNEQIELLWFYFTGVWTENT